MSFKLFRGADRLKLMTGEPLKAVSGCNPLNLCFTGLFTDPNGAADGQRAQSTEFQDLYPGSDFILWSWAQMGNGSAISSIADAVKECEAIYELMIAGNAN